jgi:hypothetical protein
MPFRSGHIPSQDELLRSADVTPSDIADAKRINAQRAPNMRPAFDATLIDEDEDPGPIPDEA